MSRKEFEVYYAREQLPCLSSVKERHWQTWMEAQATLLSAHGPVTMLTMPAINANSCITPEAKAYYDSLKKDADTPP